MKTLTQHIIEKLNPSTSTRVNIKRPSDAQDLRELIVERLNENIQEPYLLEIDTSKITDMSELFANIHDAYLVKEANLDPGDIVILDLSTWDVSNVKYMNCMFWKCTGLKELKGVENWDLTNVQTTGMFYGVDKSLRPKGI